MAKVDRDVYGPPQCGPQIPYYLPAWNVAPPLPQKCEGCEMRTEELTQLRSIVVQLSMANAALSQLVLHQATVPVPAHDTTPVIAKVDRKSRSTSSGDGQLPREVELVVPADFHEPVGHACHSCQKVTNSTYDTCRRCYRRAKSLQSSKIRPEMVSRHNLARVTSCEILPSRKRKLQEAVPAKVQLDPVSKPDVQPVEEGLCRQKSEEEVYDFRPRPEAPKPNKIERESGYDTDSTHSIISSRSDDDERRSLVSTPMNLDAVVFFPSLVPATSKAVPASKAKASISRRNKVMQGFGQLQLKSGLLLQESEEDFLAGCKEHGAIPSSSSASKPTQKSGYSKKLK